MDYSTILAVAGYIVTIAVAIGGTVYTMRRRNTPRVELYKVETVALFDSIAKDIEKLSVLYDGKPVKTGLVLFKGIFLNSGRKDISQDMVEQEISLVLPDGIKWLTAKIVDHSPALDTEMITWASALTLKTGLFKRREFIHFQAIAEIAGDDNDEQGKASPTDTFEKAIIVSHRITDLPEFRLSDLPPPKGNKYKKRKRALQMVAIVGILTTVAFWAIPSIVSWPAKTQYSYVTEKGNVAVRLKLSSDEQNVTLDGINDEFHLTLPVVDILKNPQLSSELTRDRLPLSLSIALGVTYVLLPCLYLLWMYYSRKKAERLLRLLFGEI